MKITKRQLRRIVKESMEDFDQRFDAAYKQSDGSYSGHPDEHDPAYQPGISAEEGEFGHLITSLGNQIYTQLDEMEQMLSGKEKNDYMRARSTFWKITKNAMGSEEQK